MLVAKFTTMGVPGSRRDVVDDHTKTKDDTLLNGLPDGTYGALVRVGSTRLANSWIVGMRQPRRPPSNSTKQSKEQPSQVTAVGLGACCQINPVSLSSTASLLQFVSTSNLGQFVLVVHASFSSQEGAA